MRTASGKSRNSASSIASSRRTFSRPVSGTSLAAAWALSRGIPAIAFPADWNKDGKAAGFVRNARMLRDGRPELVVAFPGGKGTAHMVKLARDAGVAVLEPAGLATTRGGGQP